MLTLPTQEELAALRHPRVEACIAEVMARFPYDTKAQAARYFEEVHQHLAPLARQLERENMVAAALIDAQKKQIDEMSAKIVEQEKSLDFAKDLGLLGD